MISPILARRLRAMPPEEVMERFSARTTESFGGSGGTPVIIAARNEERDLPATLVALSRNPELKPVIAVNGTDDQTAERAAAMGARVFECGMPFKLAALQLATGGLLDEGHKGPLLYTDADTLVGPNWAASMRRTFRSGTEAQSPQVVLGGVAFHMGSNELFDFARSARLAVKNHVIARSGEQIGASGANMAIDFGGRGKAVEAYMGLDPKLFIGEEQAIIDSLRAIGAVVLSSASFSSIALTRNDRHDLRQLLGLRQPNATPEDHIAYYPEYPDIVPYRRLFSR